MSASSSQIHEPHISFQHAALKIIWADQLIHNLNIQITGFMERKPHSIRLEPDPDGAGYLLQVHLTEQIPHTIPCLIGDICHNLRASADFCWMGLHRSINPDAGKKTLPIGANAKGLETTAKQTFKDETLRKVEDLLVNGIKSHYDFEAGGNMLFAELNHLSNWQKHNMLIPSVAVTELGDNTIIKSNDGSMIDLSRAKVSGRVAGIGGTHAEMTYDSEPTVKVLLQMKYLGRREPVTETLAQLRQTACQILQAFCEAFPGEGNPRFT